MRRLIWPVLFLLLLLLQGAVSVFYTGWLSCDLPLLALYAFAMLYGEYFGMGAGLAVGFLQDAMTVGVFGYHMLTRAALGFLVGLGKEKVVEDNNAFHMTAIAFCSVGVRFCFWWLELVRSGGRWDIFFDYFIDSLGYAAGNILLITLMMRLAKRVCEWTKKEDISY